MTVSPEVTHLAARLRPAAPPERPLKIFLWPADVNSGVWEYRIRMQRDELLRQGHEVQTSQSMSAWAKEEADVIVGQRVCTGPPSAMWQMLAAKPNRKFKLVYETDDDLFNIDPDTNPAGRIFRMPGVRQNMIDNVRLADLVTTSTVPLADVIRRWNPNVAVLPNCIESSLFSMPLPLRRGKADNRVIYGWQGSPTHAQDWEMARQAVGCVLLDHEEAQLKMLGTEYFEGLPLLDGGRPGRLTFLPWTPDLQAHYKRISKFDVTLAPLAPTKFNASKSGLRVLESYAVGVPVVASDAEAYRGWVRHGVDGFLVGSRKEWISAMERLLDPAVRVAMGDAAREVAQGWTIEKNVWKWIKAYREVAAGVEAS